MNIKSIKITLFGFIKITIGADQIRSIIKGLIGSIDWTPLTAKLVKLGLPSAVATLATTAASEWLNDLVSPESTGSEVSTK